MIKKLTKAQEAKIPEYNNKWLAYGLNTKPIEHKDAVTAVSWLYTTFLSDKSPLPLVFLVDNPLQGLTLANMLVNDGLTELRSQLGSQLDSQFDSQLYSQLDSQLRSQLDSQLRSQLYSQLRSQLGSQLESQLGSQLRSQLYSQLGSQLRSQLESQLGSQLDSQLGSQLRSQLRSQLYSQLRSQLRSQLGSQLRSQLSSQSKLNWVDNFAYLWFWGGYYCFYDFVLNELFPERRNEFSKFTAFTEYLQMCNWIIPLSGACIVIQNPVSISFNDEKQLHNVDGPAVKYKGDYELYAINDKAYGTLIEAKMAEKGLL